MSIRLFIFLAITTMIPVAALAQYPSPPPACTAGQSYSDSSNNCLYQAQQLAQAKEGLVYFQQKLLADQGAHDTAIWARGVYNVSAANVEAAIDFNIDERDAIATQTWCWTAKAPEELDKFLVVDQGVFGEDQPHPWCWATNQVTSPLPNVPYDKRRNLVKSHTPFSSCPNLYKEYERVPATPVTYHNWAAASSCTKTRWADHVDYDYFISTGYNNDPLHPCNSSNNGYANFLDFRVLAQIQVLSEMVAWADIWDEEVSTYAAAITEDNTSITSYGTSVSNWTQSLATCQQLLFVPTPPANICPCYWP